MTLHAAADDGPPSTESDPDALMRDALDRIMRGRGESLSEIAAALDISPRELAEGAIEAGAIELLRASAAIGDASRHFYAEPLRSAAIARLAEVLALDLNDELSPGRSRTIESIRRACADVLRERTTLMLDRSRIGRDGAHNARDSKHETVASVATALMRNVNAALEERGREDAREASDSP